MSSPEPTQIPLPVRLRDEATLENFLAADASRPLLGALNAQATGRGEEIIYLHGASGSGKSHLLQASCHLAGEGAQYLPLAELSAFSPSEVLQDMEHLGHLCLDDIHRVLGREEWELALFALLNRARERGCRLLVAGNAAPRALAMGLADLRSRLGWGSVFQLAAAGDEEKIAILRFRAARRGLQLGAEETAYIVARSARDLDGLLGLLDTLDHASLVEKRPLSIPFIRRILNL